MKFLGFCAAVLLTSAIMTAQGLNDPISPSWEEIRKSRSPSLLAREIGAWGSFRQENRREGGFTSQTSLSSQGREIEKQISNAPSLAASEATRTGKVNNVALPIQGGVGPFQLYQVIRGNFIQKANRVRQALKNGIKFVFGNTSSGGGGGSSNSN